ncbi:MAG: amidohydrolase [Chitinophagales bacterium]
MNKAPQLKSRWNGRYLYCSSSLLLLLLLNACNSAIEKTTLTYDMVIKNGTIYTVNTQQPEAEAVGIIADTIAFVGSLVDMEKGIGEKTQVFDLKGLTMTPGLIESHAHIMGVGENKINLDLMQTKSYKEILDQVAAAAEKAPDGDWILGRGWHQSKWETIPDQGDNSLQKMVKGFPVHDPLTAVAPNHPVVLGHASGHAILVNAKAMEMAGITKDTPQPAGGEIIKDEAGHPTGLFNELAENLIKVPEKTPSRNRRALKLAIEECLQHGITSLQDAGSGATEIALYKKFVENGDMGIRLWTMLTGWEEAFLQEWLDKGPEINLGDNRLTVRSIKLYADGALGSRGAWLLEEYSDQHNHFGHQSMSMDTVFLVAEKALKAGFQVCTHAIGDRANREVLDQYEKAFKAHPNESKDHRFRIEHAQHISADDIPRFAELGVIASIQGIHMSSDRPWAIDRLGKERIEEGAYVWQKLLQSGAKVINGTDAPVEPISPIDCFYASVTRKTLAGTPEQGYESGQRMSRQEALKSYTLDAAYGAFEEDIKGSIEVGKLADFTVFSQDLLQVPEDSIRTTKVKYTIVGGKIMFEGE